MARRPAAERRLIAVEGTRGPDIESAGQLLWRRIRSRKDTGGISRWDASGGRAKNSGRAIARYQPIGALCYAR